MEYTTINPDGRCGYRVLSYLLLKDQDLHYKTEDVMLEYVQNNAYEVLWLSCYRSISEFGRLII